MANQQSTIQKIVPAITTAIVWTLIAWCLMQFAPIIGRATQWAIVDPQQAQQIRALSPWCWLAGCGSLLFSWLSRRYAFANRIQHLHWERFEHLVADIYRRNGYRVVTRPQNGADGGIDFRAVRRGKHYIVQCKRWSKRVGVPVVREMAGLLAAERKVSGVIIVTNNDFTREAKAFASDKSIELINGEQLEQMRRGRF